MTLYVDSSALIKRYVDEPDGERWRALLASDDRLLTSRVTWVEVWRSLGLRLTGDAIRVGRSAFRTDWRHIDVVEIDAALAEEAGRLADLTRCRSLDAIHLAAVSRAGPTGIDLVTADLRQAQAARTLGWSVLGA